ncbi:NrfD/PsrC family molybdoenzyme membrane anchor subunit [Desulfococcus sp.]|uniref:NrfD/PsrC family molybdoenzyme membrane anchor subunit n=1 Tax=Desulfococcus sp. TaxID=2025834 RepID=UPI003D095E95
MTASKGAYVIWLGLIGTAIAAGLYAAFRLLTEGHYLFNANDVLMWSLPLGVYIYLALTSSGLTLLASLPMVFGVEKFEPIAKRTVFLAIATLVGGFVAIGLELGDIFHMAYIMISPNLSSPIWWMGFIYSVELVVLIVKFQRLHVGDRNSALSKAMGHISFAAALVAPLMIGSVFGLTESRVSYFGPVMSIYCLLMAVLSGTALCLFYNLTLSKVSGDKMPDAHAAVCDDVTRIFTYTLGTVIVFTLVKVAIESATVIPDFLNYRRYAQIFGGIGKLNTEVLLGLFLPFLLMAVPSVQTRNGVRLIAAALVLLGTMAMHMEILIAGQSRPIGPKAEQFPEVVHYAPSGYEWLVMLFSIAVALMLYTLGERYLKLEKTAEP